MAQEVTVTCPKDARFEGDLEGCGHTFTQEPDDEGYFDCPECGMFFNAEGLRDTPPTVDNALNACITYVIHGDADFSRMNSGLVKYFKEKVDALKKEAPDAN
jgi:hypothetical protein